MSKLYKIIIQRRQTQQVNTFIKPGGSITLPGAETAEFILRHYFPEASQRRKIIYGHKKVNYDDLINKNVDWINQDQIRASLAGFEKKKSPGPDRLKPAIFKHLPGNIIDYLQII